MASCPMLEPLIREAVAHVLTDSGTPFANDEEFMECGRVLLQLQDMVCAALVRAVDYSSLMGRMP